MAQKAPPPSALATAQAETARQVALVSSLTAQLASAASSAAALRDRAESLESQLAVAHEGYAADFARREAERSEAAAAAEAARAGAALALQAALEAEFESRVIAECDRFLAASQQRVAAADFLKLRNGERAGPRRGR